MTALALFEDRLEEGARLPLPAAHRVVYVVSGRVELDGGVTLAENQAWHGAGACVVRASAGARRWRWELGSRDADDGGYRHPAAAVAGRRRR